MDTLPIAIIGDITDILVFDEQILVTDRKSDRVLEFSPDGQFVRAVGRRGDGPGEFRSPLALLEAPEGTICERPYDVRPEGRVGPHVVLEYTL